MIVPCRIEFALISVPFALRPPSFPARRARRSLGLILTSGRVQTLFHPDGRTLLATAGADVAVSYVGEAARAGEVVEVLRTAGRRTRYSLTSETLSRLMRALET